MNPPSTIEPWKYVKRKHYQFILILKFTKINLLHLYSCYPGISNPLIITIYLYVM